jgi:proteasome lid subunit RPN8/RPN11
MRFARYSVVYEAAVLASILKRARKVYPDELGASLCGSTVPGKTEVYSIDGLYVPDQNSTRSKWEFPAGELTAARKYAANRHRLLIGMVHSHPWPRPHLLGTHLSIKDAELQAEERLLVSTVIHLWKTGWAIATWRDGFPASLRHYVVDGKRTRTLEAWLKANNSREPWAGGRFTGF